MKTIAQPLRSIADCVAANPWRTVAAALPLGIAIMLGVDAALGADAEYFNAWNLLGAWTQVLTGGSIESSGQFIMNQDSMSSAIALAIGTGVLILEPAIVLAALIWPTSLILRRSRQAREPGRPHNAQATTLYEDDTVMLDEEGVTLKSRRRRGNPRRITYRSIRNREMFDMGLWSGRLRVVGISFGRPRNWFPAGRSRINKDVAISLDVGRLLHPVIIPDDPRAVDAILGKALAG